LSKSSDLPKSSLSRKFLRRIDYLDAPSALSVSGNARPRFPLANARDDRKEVSVTVDVFNVCTRILGEVLPSIGSWVIKGTFDNPARSAVLLLFF
jgi:hypothetical protein